MASLKHKAACATSREACPALPPSRAGRPDKPLAHSDRHSVTEQTLTPSQTRLDTPLHAHSAHFDKPKTPCRVCQMLPDLQTQSHTHARLCVPRGCESVPLSHLQTRFPGLSEAPCYLSLAPGMDLLVRALDCGVLSWAGIHAVSSKDWGMEVGSRTVAAGPCSPDIL